MVDKRWWWPPTMVEKVVVANLVKGAVVVVIMVEVADGSCGRWLPVVVTIKTNIMLELYQMRID